MNFENFEPDFLIKDFIPKKSFSYKSKREQKQPNDIQVNIVFPSIHCFLFNAHIVKMWDELIRIVPIMMTNVPYGNRFLWQVSKKISRFSWQSKFGEPLSEIIIWPWFYVKIVYWKNTTVCQVYSRRAWCFHNYLFDVAWFLNFSGKHTYCWSKSSWGLIKI